MIRRDVIRPGEPERWMLISQLEHARVSFELARDWNRGGVAPLDPQAEVLAAVLHHDDGWQRWEETPDVDPQTGRPLSFLEMPIDVAVGIWEASIAVAQQLGPLAAWLVSAHFSALVSRAHESHASNPHWLVLVDEFLAEQTLRRDGWLSQVAAKTHESAVGRPLDQLAERGLAQLQLFDALSLWLCMAERTEPARFPTPNGPELTWTPVSPREITVAPWPWERTTVEIEASGRLIPVACYADRLALAAAPSELLRLVWTLRPEHA